MSRSRRPPLAIEDSWRVVDGENDSFDTRYLSSFEDDDQAMAPSNSQFSNGYSSQYSLSASQAGMSFESQDSIRDFTNHQDDEQVILREPFRPTVPPSVTSGSTTTALSLSRASLYPQSPDLQLRMPRIDVDSDLASSGRDSLRTSRGAWQWNQSSTEALDPHSNSTDDSDDSPPSRTRRKSSQGWPRESVETIRRTVMDSRGRRRSRSTRSTRTLARDARAELEPEPQPPTTGPAGRPWHAPRLLVVSLITPILLGLAAYLFSARGASLRSLASGDASSDPVSLAVLCRVPGASRISPSLCGAHAAERARKSGKKPSSSGSGGSAACNVDFSDLIATQAKFGDILARGRHGSSMPLELEGSQTATRSLRSQLKDKLEPDGEDAALRDALIGELNSYIDKMGRAGPELQTLYIHIGSTMDSIININRWTLRHIGSLAVEPAAADAAALLAWAGRLLHPLRASPRAQHDRILLDKYTEHIGLVQDRLARLADEAAALAALLARCQAHLRAIQRLARDAQLPCDPDAGLLAGLRSYLGWPAATARCEERLQPPPQLDAVDAQLAAAIPHTRGVVDALADMRAELDDLLRRAGEPPPVWDAPPPGTLREQVDVVSRGLRALEEARGRSEG